MKRIVISLGIVFILLGGAIIPLLGCGLDDFVVGSQPQEIAWEPFPTPVVVEVEKIVEVEVEKIVVMEPTPIPESEFHCFPGKVEMVSPDIANGGFMISIVGEQVICARDWKLSGIYGPVGALEANPDKPITFSDLDEIMEKQKKVQEQKVEAMH